MVVEGEDAEEDLDCCVEEEEVNEEAAEHKSRERKRRKKTKKGIALEGSHLSSCALFKGAGVCHSAPTGYTGLKGA